MLEAPRTAEREAVGNVSSLEFVSARELNLGAFSEWGEEQRIGFLERELEGKRPLLPARMVMSSEVCHTYAVACAPSGIHVSCEALVLNHGPCTFKYFSDSVSHTCAASCHDRC